MLQSFTYFRRSIKNRYKLLLQPNVNVNKYIYWATLYVLINALIELNPKNDIQKVKNINKYMNKFRRKKIVYCYREIRHNIQLCVQSTIHVRVRPTIFIIVFVRVRVRL